MCRSAFVTMASPSAHFALVVVHSNVHKELTTPVEGTLAARIP
jgi:hypothetical protein